MLSYHADADIHTNPYELGFDRLVNLETDIDFIGKEALKKIKKIGIKRNRLVLSLIVILYQDLTQLFGQLKKMVKRLVK